MGGEKEIEREIKKNEGAMEERVAKPPWVFDDVKLVDPLFSMTCSFLLNKAKTRLSLISLRSKKVQIINLN